MNVNEKEADEYEGCFGKVLCYDSLLKVARNEEELESLHGCWLLLDEADQSLWHLLNANTEVRKKRVPILQRLKEIIRYIIATGGKVILISADLNDMTVNFYQKIIGHKVKTLTIVADDQRKKKTKLYNYTENNPGHLINDLEKHVLNGGKAFICLSGQQAKSAWGTQTLETKLLSLRSQNNELPIIWLAMQKSILLGCLLLHNFKKRQYSILRIDKDTLADPNHAAYGSMANLNEILPQYDIVVASPIIETGISFDVRGHFDSVWGIAYGVQTENSVRQSLRRVRENVPRYFWSSKTGSKKVGNGSTSSKSLYASQQNKTKQHLNLLIQSGAFFDDEELIEVCPAALQTWCRMAALINLEMSTYRESVLIGIKEEGYEVIEVENDSATAKNKKSEIKTIRNSNYQRYCRGVEGANDKNEEEIQTLQDQQTRTPQEQKELKKGIIKLKYGLPVTADLVERDEAGLYKLWNLDYQLEAGRAHLPHKSRRSAQAQIFEGQYFSPDLNKSQKWAKVLGLDEIGFTKLRFAKKQMHRNDDPDLIQFQQVCIEKAPAIKEWLGVTINPNSSPVTIFKQLLKLVGLDVPLLGKEGGRGKQVRIYGPVMPSWEKDEDNKPVFDEEGNAIPIWDEREEVFAFWLKRDEEKLQKEIEQQQQALLENFISAINKSLEAVCSFLKGLKIEQRWQLVYGQLDEFPEAAKLFCNEYLQSPAIQVLLQTQQPEESLVTQPENSSKITIKSFLQAIDSGDTEKIARLLATLELDSRYLLIFEQLELHPEQSAMFFNQYYEVPQIARLLVPEVEAATNLLSNCYSPEDLKNSLYSNGKLAATFTRKKLNQACKLLTKSKQALIRQWVAAI